MQRTLLTTPTTFIPSIFQSRISNNPTNLTSSTIQSTHLITKPLKSFPSTCYIPNPQTSTPNPSTLPQTSQPILILYRDDDMRIHDHPALHFASTCQNPIVPLILLPSNPNSFWLDCVNDLRQTFRNLGTDLYIRQITSSNTSAQIVAHFAQEINACKVHFHTSVYQDSREEEKLLKKLLDPHHITIHTFWSGSLHSPETLPCNLQQLPDDCDGFEQMLRNTPVADPLPIPKELRGLGSWIDPGLLPDRSICQQDENTKMVYGGEQAGLKRMKDYVNGKSDQVADVGNGIGRLPHVDTRFGRLDPFLSTGCVSPRLLYHQVVKKVSKLSLRRYCAELELLLRDFVRFMTLKHGVYAM